VITTFVKVEITRLKQYTWMGSGEQESRNIPTDKFCWGNYTYQQYPLSKHREFQNKYK